MGITTNTMQLGTFPVDKTNYEEIKEALVSFGLTPNQVKVFFYLGKIGAKTASEIARAVNVPRSETYHLLTALQNKELLMHHFNTQSSFHPCQLKRHYQF
jgi:sugar-specific transcriptional regulator TrmB